MSHVLGRLEDIPDGEGKGFTVDTGSGNQEIFVVRRGDRVFGYVNSCPHTGTPLDWIENQFMTPDKKLIMCATHCALFRIEDGYCIDGPCGGDSLQALSIRLEDGCIVLEDGA